MSLCPRHRPSKKPAVLATIRAALRAQFEDFAARSRQTRAASADPESRAEGKYDTRATEESFLADGQARQAQQAAEALAAIELLGEPRPFGPGVPIDPGALVRVEFTPGGAGSGGGSGGAWFFLAPAAGGLEVVVDGIEVTVLTPGSPLGRQLLGRVAGARLSVPPGLIADVF